MRPERRREELLSALTRGRMRIPDLALRFGVSVRTLHRDVARLREAGYAIASAPGPRGGVWLAEWSRPAPVTADVDRLRQVLVHLAATGAPPALITPLLDGLPAQLRDRLRAVVDATRRGPTVAVLDGSVLATLERALHDRWPLRLTCGIHRRVLPQALILRDTAWLLEGELLRTGTRETFPLAQQERVQRDARPWGRPGSGSRRVRARRPDDPPPPNVRYPVMAGHLPPWATGWVTGHDG